VTTGRWARWLDRHAGLLLLAPAVIVIVAVVLYPLAYSLWASFVDYDVPAHPWIGLRNYRNIVEFSAGPGALARTFGLCGTAVMLEFVLGFLLALSIASGGRWRSRLIPVLVLPIFAGSVAAGLFWRLFLDAEIGPVNFILGELVGHPVTLDWTSSTWLTYLGIVLADAWQWTPIIFVIMLAALRTIPRELYEAADLDGASPRKAFVFVTLPLLTPVALLVLMLRLLDAVKLFDVPLIFGGSSEATETAAVYLYREGFTFFHFGYASAGSWLFVAAIALAAGPLVYLLLRPRAAWA
jgi:multiple sugar transport system permease protein